MTKIKTAKKNQPSEKTDKDDDDSDKKDQKDKKASSFLENQEGFDKRLISFDQNQWAKAQLIRIARNAPKSIPKIQAAIDQRVASANVQGALKRHRYLRQFPLEFVAPKLRLELAEKLIADSYVAEAENVLASLLGFLPTTAEQIETAEISYNDLKKDVFVDLWSKIRDAQYGTEAKVQEAEDITLSEEINFNRVDFKTTQVSSERFYPTVVQPRGEAASRIFSGKLLSVWAGEQVQEFEVFSPTGESETRFKMFKEGLDRSFRFKNGSGWIQTNHSLAIVRHGDLLMALDLSKLDSGQAAVMWTMRVSQGRRTLIKDELDLAVSPGLPPEDVTASFPTTGCCCFIERGKLKCIDAFTGMTLWTRSKDASHSYVLANASQVVTMNSRLNEINAFDLRTGERLKTQSISDPMGTLWDVNGLSFTALGKFSQQALDELSDFEDFRPKKVEAKVEEKEIESDAEATKKLKKAEETEKKKKSSSSRPKGSRFLYRYDVGVGDYVWKKAFDGEAVICRLSDDRFAALTNDNQLYIFDLKTGQQLAKIPSGLTEEQRNKIDFIGAYQHRGQDLIVMASTHRIAFRASGFNFQASRSYDTFIYGHLMLLSKDKLEPVWNRLAQLDGFQLQPMLPSTSPLLIFNRRLQPMGTKPKQEKPPLGQRTISGYPMQILALNMNDGHVVTNEIIESTSVIRDFTSPVVDLTAGTINMKLGVHEIELTLKTSSDEPPAPVASVTKSNPIPQAFGVAEEASQVAVFFGHFGFVILSYGDPVRCLKCSAS